MKAKYAAIVLAHYDWCHDSLNSAIADDCRELNHDGWSTKILDRFQLYYEFLAATGHQDLADVLHDVTEGVRP